MYESIKEFAARTGFKYSAIRLLCLRGQLPYVLVGSNRRMIPIQEGLTALEAMIVPARQTVKETKEENK